MQPVAGIGGCGAGGGAARFGQPHGAMAAGGVPVCDSSDVVADVTIISDRASHIVGNLLEMMPRLIQASLLRKNVSEQSVIYVICCLHA